MSAGTPDAARVARITERALELARCVYAEGPGDIASLAHGDRALLRAAADRVKTMRASGPAGRSAEVLAVSLLIDAGDLLKPQARAGGKDAQRSAGRSEWPYEPPPDVDEEGGAG